MPVSIFDKVTNAISSQVPDLFSLLSSEIQIRDGDFFFQIASGLKILKLDIVEPSRFMTHPRQDGSPQTDFIVEDPVTITLDGIFDSEDYASNMAQLRIAKNTGTKLTIQARGNTYTNMYIETLPSTASAEKFSTLEVNVFFKEAIVFTLESTGFSLDDLANPLDSDIVQNGLKTASASVGSIQAKATSAVTGYF